MAFQYKIFNTLWADSYRPKVQMTEKNMTKRAHRVIIVVTRGDMLMLNCSILIDNYRLSVKLGVIYDADKNNE